ncbi:hypothetical protein GLE_5489 [Lysobacter enzymogenes]|uniref:Uncharacterized protein n=1 Tax=Lysobacter enzymogenes TaxID=69 RepID=A0A0S2DQI8_LYSEN|nr:hypothetical protein [Lysobacter enzymogenes]ALN60830.1 hypothetical protein GLE_5489 [Lysobacter enzymogenes]QCW24396.1 hypothetical protein FE772_00655 [Lysobacter enzymogenes]
MTLDVIFATAGVTHAHLIDDAYDQAPVDINTDEEIERFLNALDDDQFDAVAQLLKIDAAEDTLRAALSDLKHVRRLFRARAQFKPASDHLFAVYVRERQDRRARLKPLVDRLKASGVTCYTYGTDAPKTNREAPQLLFIDLQLKTRGGLTVEDALTEYRRISERYPDARPFVFLASTLAAALDNNKEAFRAGAKLFISQFEALDKTRIKDEDELEAILGAYAKALPRLREMHIAIDEVSSAVKYAGERLAETLLSLDLVDYFVLHANTVAIEKSKLGTYVSEILMEYLTHEVEASSGFWNFAAALDSWTLHDIPRSRFGFTRPARKIYSGNMLHAKNRLLSEVDRKLAPEHGYFALGDIFFSTKELAAGQVKQALAVITPACDLARPEELQQRTILLSEGRVSKAKEFSLPTADHGVAAVVIDHPTQVNQQLLIQWDRKRLRTWDKADISNFADDEKREWLRVGRLRPLYAVQLQHSITADLSRIGVQRTPSLLVPHGLTAFVRDGKVWRSLDATDMNDPNAAALSVTEDKKKKTAFIVSDPSARRIFKELRDWVTKHPLSATFNELEQLLKTPDVLQRLLYVEQKPNDKDMYDKVCYPFADTALPNPQCVAFVRPNSESSYDSVSGGTAQADGQNASVLFKFRKVP